LLTLTFFVVLFGTACKKEVVVTSSVQNEGTIITDSATIDAPARRSLMEEQAR
jgi:hypothetical protein